MKSVFLNLKPISYFFGVYMAWVLTRNYWSLLYHDLIASIWEKATLILVGNFNSSRNYIITAATSFVRSQNGFHCKHTSLLKNSLLTHVLWKDTWYIQYQNIFYVLDCWSADGTLCYLWKKHCRLKYMLELAVAYF